MNSIERYKNGDITLDELRRQAQEDPEFGKQVEAFLDSGELSDEDLDNISGGGAPLAGIDYNISGF